MKELVNKLVEENARISQECARRDAEQAERDAMHKAEQAERDAKHKDEMDRLIAALAQRPQQNQAGVVNQQPDPAAVRASALSKMALSLSKR